MLVLPAVASSVASFQLQKVKVAAGRARIRERERERKRGEVCKRDSESDAPSTASHVLLIFFSTWTPVAHASTLDHGECRRFVVSAAAGDDVAAVASVVAAAVALNA